jgi:non-heme chloroperoxidase
MDTYADDLAALIETLDLKNVTLVGHSTGGGEVARYSGGHGKQARVEGCVDRPGATPDAEEQSRRPGLPSFIRLDPAYG